MMMMRGVSTRIMRPIAPYYLKNTKSIFVSLKNTSLTTHTQSSVLKQTCCLGAMSLLGISNGRGNRWIHSHSNFVALDETISGLTHNNTVKLVPLGILLILANVTSFIHVTTNNATTGITVSAGTRTDSSIDERQKQDWDSFMLTSMNPKDDDDGDEEENPSVENIVDDTDNHVTINTVEMPSTVQDEDPYDHLPDHDDETTCTICLLNRQGPCKPYWRKLEWCMKHNLEKKHEGTSSSGGGEHCDKYMIPWLQCVQSYRNTYTVLMNQMYQKDYIDPVEASIHDQDKVLFNKVHPDSFLDLDDWKLYKVREKMDPNEGLTIANKKSTTQDVVVTAATNDIQHEEDTVLDPPDVFLIAASAKVNLIDPTTKRPVTIAYIRDQNRQVLGFDQFKKEKEERKKEHGGILLDSDVATFTFYIDPQTTQSIQVFALYESQGNDSDHNDDDDGDDKNHINGKDTHDGKEQDEEPILSTLYYSNNIEL